MQPLMRTQLLRSFGFFSLILLMTAPVQALTVTFTRSNFGFDTGDGDSTNIFAPQDLQDPLLPAVVGWSFRYEGTLAGTLEVTNTDYGDSAAPVGASATSISSMYVNGFDFPFAYSTATSILEASCTGIGSCTGFDSELKPFLFETGFQASPLPITIDLGVRVSGATHRSPWDELTSVNPDYALVLGNSDAHGLATFRIEYAPEPGTALLVALGVGAIATRRRSAR
jgi:hypothetical protein